MTTFAKKYDADFLNQLTGQFEEKNMSITTEEDNVLYENIRHIRQVLDTLANDLRDVQQFLDASSQDMRDVKTRMTNLEQSTASGFANIQSGLAVNNRRLDRVDERIAQFERRPDQRFT